MGTCLSGRPLPRVPRCRRTEVNGYAQLLSEQAGDPVTAQVLLYNPCGYRILPGGEMARNLVQRMCDWFAGSMGSPGVEDRRGAV
jgi:hypothetical protein